MLKPESVTYGDTIFNFKQHLKPDVYKRNNP